MNKEGSCQRNICECDKRWSETLANFEDDFDPVYHKNRGVEVGSTWKYNNECKRSKGIFGKPEKCCGASYPDKMPLQKVHRSIRDLVNNVTVFWIHNQFYFIFLLIFQTFAETWVQPIQNLIWLIRFRKRQIHLPVSAFRRILGHNNRCLSQYSTKTFS